MQRNGCRDRLVLGFLALVVVLVGFGGMGLLTVRSLPGRYAYYLPEPLQRLRTRSHPDVLPTPVAVVASSSIATPTPSPASTDMASPSAAPTETLSPSPTSLPSPTPPISLTLTGFRHEHQGWNNCGPSTLAMALSYLGRTETQYDAAPVLKPDPEDKNVSLWEMEAYVEDLGLGALTRVGGTLGRLKALVRAGFSVIVETWYVSDPSDQMGHYRLIVGYDDAAREFLTYDSLHGPDVAVDYQAMDELWRVFNRAYMVVYSPAQEAELERLLGPDADDVAMYQRALAVARSEAANLPAQCVAYADCDDWVGFSWFNVGSSLTSLGRHAEAAPAYDQARDAGLPVRMLWYQFGPYESYYAVGRYEDVIALADVTLQTASNLEESYYWRGKARLAVGDQDGAEADFRKALRYHPEWAPAVDALAGLESN